MKNSYEYYSQVIKPIEKKYNRMCTLYAIFRINRFRLKRDIYNSFLNNYYKNFLINDEYLENLKLHFK